MRRIELRDDDVHAGSVVDPCIPVSGRGTQEVEAWSLLTITLRVSFTSRISPQALIYPDHPEGEWCEVVDVNPYRGGTPDRGSKSAWLEHRGDQCPHRQTHQIEVSAVYCRLPAGLTEPLGQGSLSTWCG